MKIDIEKIKAKKTTLELLEFSFINFDKPSGPTSFSVDLFVKKALDLKKTSHLGTLDPMVSGVLTIGLNRACKLASFLMGADKTYVGIMRMQSDFDVKKLKDEVKKFIGNITQLPPVKSAVARRERQREIKSFEIVEIDGRDVIFITEVQAGTYIRKLVHDIGENIGGAHMLELRRTRAGIFEESKTFTLYDFEKAVAEYKVGKEKLLRDMLIPGEIITEIMPVSFVRKNLKMLLTGKPIMKGDIDKVHDGRFAVFSGDKLIEIAKSSKEGNIVARPEFVMS